jgi:predicted tellurium resistance membrane protein TerC
METLVMSQTDTLKEKIEKAKGVLAESRENFEKNPENYSARLLLLSTEIYLADLLKQLDTIIAADQPPQSISGLADAGAAVKRGGNG